MAETEIEELIWEIASNSARKGPGWAQEGVVLREVRDRISGDDSGPDLSVQQMVLL